MWVWVSRKLKGNEKYIGLPEYVDRFFRIHHFQYQPFQQHPHALLLFILLRLYTILNKTLLVYSTSTTRTRIPRIVHSSTVSIRINPPASLWLRTLRSAQRTLYKQKCGQWNISFSMTSKCKNLHKMHHSFLCFQFTIAFCGTLSQSGINSFVYTHGLFCTKIKNKNV